MGSKVEMNGALQINEKQGFPIDLLNVNEHQESGIDFDSIKDVVFSFGNKSNARVYQIPPSRNFLIQNLDGKWIYWGLIEVIEQSISSKGDGLSVTSGKFKIISLFEPEVQREITKSLARSDKSFF